MVDAEKADAPEEPQINMDAEWKDIYDFIEMLNLFKPVKLYNIKNYNSDIPEEWTNAEILDDVNKEDESILVTTKFNKRIQY